MDYDEKVSARLHMSLDEIIGQEQLDKKRRGGGRVLEADTNAGAVPVPAKNMIAGRPPASPMPNYAPRHTMPRPAPGAFGGYPSKQPHAARPPVVISSGLPGRLPGPHPFSVAHRPYAGVSVPVEQRWPTARPPGHGYVGGVIPVNNNGMPPPPPMAGEGHNHSYGAASPFAVPQRSVGHDDIAYGTRRPQVAPYTMRPPAGPQRYAWKRSRGAAADQWGSGGSGEIQILNYQGAPQNVPTGHAPPAANDNGHRSHQMPYAGYNASGYAGHPDQPHPNYYEAPYSRDTAAEAVHPYDADQGDRYNRHAPARYDNRGRPAFDDYNYRSHPRTEERTSEADYAYSGSRAAHSAATHRTSPSSRGAPPSASCGRREYTVIVSNVPKDLPAVEIQEAFSCMGTVLRTDVMLNSKGEHTGRVCIAFASPDAAKAAVAQFDEGDLNGNTIRVFAE